MELPGGFKFLLPNQVAAPRSSEQDTAGFAEKY